MDQDYIADRFNLTGLFTAVPDYNLTMDVILDQMDELIPDEDERQELIKAACHLYGLIHARFILTPRGQQKMVRHQQLKA